MRGARARRSGSAQYAIIDGFTVRNSGSSNSGIIVTASGATIANNKISGCGWGIFLETGTGSTVKGNTVTGAASSGIGVRNSNRNTITGNTVTNCGKGLSIEGTSSGNTIYFNSFNNGYSVSGVTNTYSSPSALAYTYHGKAWPARVLGNFWGNYRSTDQNDNGLGDAVYRSNGITDNNPLMEPVSSFSPGGTISPTPTPGPIVTPTPRPSVTPTPVPTASPTPRPTVTPTPTPNPTVTPTPAPGTGPYSGKVVGFAAARYGISPFPGSDYWSNFAKLQATKLSGAGTEGVWVIGGIWQGGICYLNFPSSTRYSNIAFASTDENEAYLDYFDTHGIKVYLQVEPGLADVNQVIRLVLDRYSKHPSVIGVGIDTEWYKAPTYSGGKPVTDQEAAQWYNLITSYNSGYTMAFTHWQANHMPPTYRKGVYFLYDGLGASSLADLTSYYVNWGKAFPNNPVGIYLGFTEDKKWWSTYRDPFYTCAQNMFSNVPNTRGVYWTEFEIRSIYTG